MSKTYVFVQCGVRAVKLRQMSVSVFLHIGIGISLIGDKIISVSDFSRYLGVSG